MMPIAEMVIKFAIELIEVISRAASPRVAADVEPVTESIVIGSGHHVEQSVDYSRSVDPQTIRIAAENIECLKIPRGGCRAHRIAEQVHSGDGGVGVAVLHAGI